MDEDRLVALDGAQQAKSDVLPNPPTKASTLSWVASFAAMLAEVLGSPFVSSTISSILRPNKPAGLVHLVGGVLDAPEDLVPAAGERAGQRQGNADPDRRLLRPRGCERDGARQHGACQDAP